MTPGRPERYTLEGHYVQKGNTERQQGRLFLAPNRLFYGGITDVITGGNLSPKKVIGMQFGDDGALALLKLPRRFDLCPIIWYARRNEKLSRRLPSEEAGVLAGTYDCVWGPAEGMPFAMLQAITADSIEPELDCVARLNPTELEMAFFQRDVLDHMEKAARRNQQIGQLRIRDWHYSA